MSELRLTPMLLASAVALLWMSVADSVAVLRLFLFASTAAGLLLMAAPASSVWPPTLIWKPPSPARMADCSVTLW
jgi:hypothetical protein